MAACGRACKVAIERVRRSDRLTWDARTVGFSPDGTTTSAGSFRLRPCSPGRSGDLHAECVRSGPSLLPAQGTDFEPGVRLVAADSPREEATLGGAYEPDRRCLVWWGGGG